MFLALHITDSWLTSPVARRIYFVSAILTIFLVGMVLAIVLGAFAAGGTLESSPVLELILRTLLFPGVLGAAVLWIAMWYFWSRHHSGENTAKVPWAIIIWLLGPIGALLYFKFFYLRSPLVRTAPKQQAASA